MKYVSLDYDQAHAVQARNRFLEWDGWDLVTFRADPRGYTKQNGKFKNGVWGLEFRYPLNENGVWLVPEAYVTRR